MCSRRPPAYHTQSSERFKVVTLDGTLINKAGLITGGSSPQEKARAAKWNQKEHDGLKGEQDKVSSTGLEHPSRPPYAHHPSLGRCS